MNLSIKISKVVKYISFEKSDVIVVERAGEDSSHPWYRLRHQAPLLLQLILLLSSLLNNNKKRRRRRTIGGSSNPSVKISSLKKNLLYLYHTWAQLLRPSHVLICTWTCRWSHLLARDMHVTFCTGPRPSSRPSHLRPYSWPSWKTSTAFANKSSLL